MLETTNNKRYRLFMKNDKLYIVDSDTNIVSIFFPWLIWLFPMNGYEIENPIGFQTKDKEHTNRKGGLVITSAVLSIVMIRVIPAKYFIGKPYPDNEKLLTVLIISLIVALLIFRMSVSRKRLYKGEVKASIKVRVDLFKYFRVNLKSLIIYSIGLIISSLFLIELFKMFIFGGNPVVLVIFLMIYSFLIFANQTMQTPIKYDIQIMNLKEDRTDK